MRSIGQNSELEYLTNPIIHGSGERYLHLAAECVIDIGNHIVSDQQLGSPGSYREIFFLLGEANILEAPLAKKMEDLAGLRNVLVHDYLQIEHSQTYEFIKNELTWIEKFVEAVEQFL